MRHRKQKVTLGRTKAQREALLRTLAVSLILHGSIRTTKAKARALRMFIEPMVTKAKTGSLAARRQIARELSTNTAVNKMMEDIGPTYKERPGGYTRIVSLAPRPQDGAAMARIEFVS
ncbi:MAG TPA: 50S ribosomal protein L17 [Candidatus Magasanikbacteria bacterium]|nr:MAG: 50S ribosomal protein L17 [Candidatus Magasanikbacteria bacterium RIFCSPLOWO2_02_FULL_47_16]OGH80068.1 MAG: 50S ribosomal protein L17 [Candidatus Magasanikbacteria bacterium RIFCSPHIGHO2_02_FULL_48_18]OGH82828.1 MAG: 50S ribosomal protein L17 [Candidatus Magasanikbacteria bacterium RIFCSPLOWO2_12_FULL_47_9b]HAZ28450.1 50S ribosomal protein L17 [Candidatus Magasanikbacteria bacterium]